MADQLTLNAQTLNPGIINGGRLTLLTGVPVTVADLIGISNLRFTPGAPPFYGDRIALPNPTAGTWPEYAFTEKTVVLAGLTTGKNYDVFGYDKAGNVAVDLGTAWTSDTARALAVSTVNGILVNTAGFTSVIAGDTVAAAAGRYLGTIRATAATTTESSNAKRFLWNRYNQVPRTLMLLDPATSWTYALTAFQQANANAANQVEVVVGDIGCPLDLTVYGMCETNASSTIVVGIGVDSTTVPSASAIAVRGGNTSGAVVMAGVSIARLETTVPLGYHKYCWLEAAVVAASVTIYGTSSSTPPTFQTGMSGHVLA